MVNWRGALLYCHNKIFRYYLPDLEENVLEKTCFIQKKMENEVIPNSHLNQAKRFQVFCTNIL